MLKGKTALVTGSTSGIGKAIATRLAAEGANVILNGFGDAKEIEALRAGIERDHKVRAAFSGADLTKPEAIEAMMAEAAAQFGGVDILVNNAGVAPLQRNDIIDLTEESYDRVMNINLKGPLFFAQKIAREMIWLKQQINEYSPKIIFISSSHARNFKRYNYIITYSSIITI